MVWTSTCPSARRPDPEGHFPTEPLRAFLEVQGFKSLLSKVGCRIAGTAAAFRRPLASNACGIRRRRTPAAARRSVPFDHKAYETSSPKGVAAGLLRPENAVFVRGRYRDRRHPIGIRARLVGVSLSIEPHGLLHPRRPHRRRHAQRRARQLSMHALARLTVLGTPPPQDRAQTQI